MRLVFIGAIDRWTRSVATIHRYVACGKALGHKIAVYGDSNPELNELEFTTDISGTDVAVFLVQIPEDIPAMPGLARLMDELPRENRIVLDLWGRFNDTVRIEHDFNHLEKFDGHGSWEWIEAIEALAPRVLQPTLTPRRSDAQSFLFHGFDPNMVKRTYASANDASTAWLEAGKAEKPYGVVYVGSNWQRWMQVSKFMNEYAPVSDKVGQICLAGWDWSERPEWAVEMGIKGIDTDRELLADLRVEVRQGIAFDSVVDLLSQGRFAPMFHRPLFRELGLVTNRTFETFYADTMPVLMLPKEFVSKIYGDAAVRLVPESNVADHLCNALDDPLPYWEAVLRTRDHLGKNHSYLQRFEQLEKLLTTRESIPTAP